MEQMMADSQTIRDTNRPPRWRRFIKEFFWPFKNIDAQLATFGVLLVAWIIGFITVLIWASNQTRDWTNQGLALLAGMATIGLYVGITALALRAWVESE